MQYGSYRLSPGKDGHSIVKSRDDFSAKVKRAVAARAGWHCSLCQKLTIGPSEEAADASTNIGKAAHICAASREGPRYDERMTPAERAGIDNAIWLCSDDATLIDRDTIAFPAPKLHGIKQEHEAACARSVRTGSGLQLVSGLLAVGPETVFTGSVTHFAAESWTLRLNHFLIGDLHSLMSFIGHFRDAISDDRYVLSNELGEGRVLADAPSLTKQDDGGYTLSCPLGPVAPRNDVQRLGSGLAMHPSTNDTFLDEKGHIARVSGLDYFPQRVREVLSMQRGESPFFPTAGVRFFEYFEAYRGSPWLDLLFTLEVIHKTSIPIGSNGRPALDCVTRVRSVQLLADTPTDNRLPIRVALDVKALGLWERELSIYMPTAEQMAKRAAMLASMPGWPEVIKQ